MDISVVLYDEILQMCVKLVSTCIFYANLSWVNLSILPRKVLKIEDKLKLLNKGVTSRCEQGKQFSGPSDTHPVLDTFIDIRKTIRPADNLQMIWSFETV